MISAYSAILAHQKDDWLPFLESIGVDREFKPLFTADPERDDYAVIVRQHAGTIIKYIVTAYSIESPLIVIGTDWNKTKKKIFESVSGKPNAQIHEAVVLLRSPSVIRAIDNWLQYRDENLFTQMQVLKDLQVEMRITSISQIKKSSGELDYDQKFRNAEYAIKLNKMISETESELIQNSEKLKDAVQEVRTEAKRLNILSVESMLKEHNNGAGPEL